MNETDFLQCFARNPDGGWRAIKPVKIGSVEMGPGVSFSRGVSMGGMNVAEVLDQLAQKHPHLVQT